MNHKIIVSTLFGVAFVVLVTRLVSSTAHAATPSTINPSAHYLFFHHNYYVETKGPDGDCKYSDILKAFADMGFIVISEIRPKDVSVIDYSFKAAKDVQSLLDAGVPQENITVAGHSKGGVITIRVASLLEKAKLNYLVLAGFEIKALEKAYPDFTRLKGNFLSVYASSDKVAGSGKAAFSKAREGLTAQEITLENAGGHQLFFKPADVWFEPVVVWLKHLN